MIALTVALVVPWAGGILLLVCGALVTLVHQLARLVEGGR